MNDTKKCGNCRDEIADCICYMRMVRDRDAEIAILTAEVARLTAQNDAIRNPKSPPDCVNYSDMCPVCVGYDEQKAKRETAERERDEARKEIEALVWNLAGCGTIAESGRPQEFDATMARPALVSVSDMAAKLQTAERELEALRAAVRWYFSSSGIDSAGLFDGVNGEHAEALRRATT